jgi:Ribosomal protein L32
MRKEESGWPRRVKVGYGTAASKRGLHPRGFVDTIIWREADLEKLDPKTHIVRLARRIGERKRLAILDRARHLNFHIANPGKEETRPVTEESAPATTTEPAEAGSQTAKTTEREDDELSEIASVKEEDASSKDEASDDASMEEDAE